MTEHLRQLRTDLLMQIERLVEERDALRSVVQQVHGIASAIPVSTSAIGMHYYLLKIKEMCAQAIDTDKQV